MKEYIVHAPKTKATAVEEYTSFYGEPVEELIRCRDCKEYAEWGDSMICMRLGSYYGNTNPNDFCSRAERKDNETY